MHFIIDLNGILIDSEQFKLEWQKQDVHRRYL